MHRHFNSRYLFTMDDKANTRLTSGRTYHDSIKAEFGLQAIGLPHISTVHCAKKAVRLKVIVFKSDRIDIYFSLWRR